MNQSFERQITARLKELEKLGLRRILKKVEKHKPPIIEVEGKPMVNFASNDYLGLSGHKSIAKAVKKSFDDFSFGSVASRLVSGNTSWHEQLEDDLANLKNKENCAVFTSGFVANVGVLSALLNSDSVVFSDELNHASIVDGCRISKAKIHVYKHNDMNHLEQLLMKYSTENSLIITDSVFSFSGDCASLEEIVGLAQKFDVPLMIDDAHATGVFGKNGAGLADHLGLTEDIDIIMGTLSKAMGCFGGFVCTSSNIRDYVVTKSRNMLFTTSLPPSICAGAVAAVKLCKEENKLRKKLWKNVQYFGNRFLESGLMKTKPESPIVFIKIGDNNKTVAIQNELLKNGLFAAAFRPPTTPPDKAGLRISITAAQKKEHLEQLADILNKFY